LYEELSPSAVLLRVFATLDYEKLPQRERDFALELARSRTFLDELKPKTPVVTLLGSRGKRPSWNHRHRSERHLAIPLVSASFIKTIPMVSRLMGDMGTGLEWVQKQDQNMTVTSMGQMARVLYVEDALETRTRDGYDVIPDRSFVEEYKIRTVLALGGAYLNGTVVAVVLFTNELVPREKVEKLMPVLHGFKVATMKLVMQGKLFSQSGS
ncbi:MAG TPA: hypothetical protein VIG29_23175, partial [Vicinamibacteria bacterium]